MASPSHLADPLIGRADDKQIVIGPLVQREDIPLPYFMFGLHEADGPYFDMVQVESEEIRLAVLAHLAARVVIIHECGDELSMAKMIHALWPCEKTEQYVTRLSPRGLSPLRPNGTSYASSAYQIVGGLQAEGKRSGGLQAKVLENKGRSEHRQRRGVGGLPRPPMGPKTAKWRPSSK
jgi:hypothetical protein